MGDSSTSFISFTLPSGVSSSCNPFIFLATVLRYLKIHTSICSLDKISLGMFQIAFQLFRKASTYASKLYMSLLAYHK